MWLKIQSPIECACVKKADTKEGKRSDARAAMDEASERCCIERHTDCVPEMMMQGGCGAGEREKVLSRRREGNLSGKRGQEKSEEEEGERDMDAVLDDSLDNKSCDQASLERGWTRRRRCWCRSRSRTLKSRAKKGITITRTTEERARDVQTQEHTDERR